MNTSGMMAGVLVVGSMNHSLDMQPQGYYTTESIPARNTKKTVAVRISVKKTKK